MRVGRGLALVCALVAKGLRRTAREAPVTTPLLLFAVTRELWNWIDKRLGVILKSAARNCHRHLPEVSGPPIS